MSIASTSTVRAAACAALALLPMLGTGCGRQSAAAGAQSPPAPSLCAPVRVQKDRLTDPPATVVPAEEVSFLQDRQTQASTPAMPAVRTIPLTSEANAKAREPLAAGSSAPSTGRPEFYVLQKGDTLYGVARKFSVKPKDLIAANSIPDPNHVQAGLRVRIP